MSRGSPTVLVTGASGMIGGALAKRLVVAGVTTRGAVRRSRGSCPPGVSLFEGATLDRDFDWRPALDGCDAVVHTAGRAHVLTKESADAAQDFRRVNVHGTLRLASQAAQAGVQRFVFLSSLKVNGDRTEIGAPFRASDPPAPADPYAESKHEAEQGLRGIATATGMQLVIVRSSLVYGPGVRANFLSMLRWLEHRMPLPLGALHNVRSLIGIDNLVDFLAVCVAHEAAAGRTFLVSDGEDLSTTELLRRAGAALGHPARLIPVPASLLRLAALAPGVGATIERLTTSLQADIGETRRALGWNPPFTVDDQLRATARWYLARSGAAR